MLTELFERLKGREAKHQLHVWISDENVLDEGFTSRLVNPNEDYFQFRMNEMFLVNAREYAREFIPVAIVMSDFLYHGRQQNGPKREVLPFIVGPNLIRGLDTQSENASILLRNIKVQDWTPYRGDDVGLFVGLYRMQVNNLVNNLLRVVQGVSENIGVAGLGDYMKFAYTISSGLADLIGMEEIEFRTGGKDEFQQAEEGKYAFKKGYRVYLNAASDEFHADKFWVRDEELYYGENKNNLKRFDKCDYCLLKVDSTDKRKDYESLDFHKTWLRARSQVLYGNITGAQSLLLECARQISESPDLTDDHQEILIELYLANFEKVKERHALLNGISKKKSNSTRGGAQGLTAIDSMMSLVQNAQKKGIDSKDLKGLATTSKHLDKLFTDKENMPEPDSVMLNQQIDKLKAIKLSNKLTDKVGAAAMVNTLSAGLFK